MADTKPDYGPGGYLPERAARRARKIVLRAPMGLGWPLAALGAGLVLALAGVLWLRTTSRPPGPPYVQAGPITAVDPAGAAAVDVRGLTHGALVVRAGGPVRAFAAPAGRVVWCPRSRRVESASAVWNPDGTLVGGHGESLRPVGARVFDGVLYVAPTPGDAPAPDPDADERPACV